MLSEKQKVTGEVIREAENRDLPVSTGQPSFKLPGAASMDPAWWSEWGLLRHSQDPFHRPGHKPHSSQLGLPSCKPQVSLPPGKGSVVTEEKQKTNAGPFSSSAGPWERHRGAC